MNKYIFHFFIPKSGYTYEPVVERNLKENENLQGMDGDVVGIRGNNLIPANMLQTCIILCNTIWLDRVYSHLNPISCSKHWIQTPAVIITNENVKNHKEKNGEEWTSECEADIRWR